jgi:hypothetical protein
MSVLGLVMHPLVVATELISDENEAHDTPAENVWRRDNRRFDDVRPAAKFDPDLGPVAHQERDVVEQFLILRLGRAVIALESHLLTLRSARRFSRFPFETLASMCAAVVPQQQRSQAHIRAQQRLPNHLIIGRRQSKVLASCVNIAQIAL